MTVSKDTQAMINARIGQIDALISAQLNALMHHEDFQRLEASWRGLHYFVHQSETGTQLKIRVLGDAGQFLALMQSATPFYQALGGKRFRFLRNVDDPNQLLVEIEYEAHAGLELNRQKVASDPMVRTFLQGWRTMLSGSAEVDVFEDVTNK